MKKLYRSRVFLFLENRFFCFDQVHCKYYMTKLVVFCIRRKFLFVLQLIFFENFLIKSRLWNCIKKKFFSSMCVCVCVCFNIVIKENTKLNLALGKSNAVQSKLKLYVAQDVSFFFLTCFSKHVPY